MSRLWTHFDTMLIRIQVYEALVDVVSYPALDTLVDSVSSNEQRFRSKIMHRRHAHIYWIYISDIYIYIYLYIYIYIHIC